MRILFITSTRLGDGILSTGILDHLIKTNPGAQVTVACGPLVAGLFKGNPNVVRVIAMNKRKYRMHWFDLFKQTFQRWDIIVDLRNSIVSRLLPARRKFILGQHDGQTHKVEQNAKVIGVSPAPAPTLWFDEELEAKGRALVPDGNTPVLAIGPASNWGPKTWPAENFVALIERITADDGLLPDARIAVFAAPGEEEIAYRVLNMFPKDRQINIIAKAKPIEAAAAMKRCQLYVGNDSGLMHCAAAIGVPTLGLFGPTHAHLYRPWGDHCAYVSTPETTETLLKRAEDIAALRSLMTGLTVDRAWEAVQNLWRKVSVAPKKAA